MKKIKLIVLFSLLTVMLTACSGGSETGSKKVDTSTKEEKITVKTSPDKYTWYIKNYVGKNAASIGYASLGGDRLDTYGDGHLKIVFINEEGTYINIEDEKKLKEYVVTEQNIDPNTEMKYTYEKEEDGKESDVSIEHQTYEEIVLGVKKVNATGSNVEVSETKKSPDKYTHYIRNYVGRNLTMCGYVSLGEDLLDKYGEATVKLIVTTDDGSYVDVTDEKVLKKYKVTDQSIPANTELKLEFDKDEDGKEYSFVNAQNVEEVELSVEALE